jgi:4-diphosphocytidyl-2-C-methyl-D-erythritol kinase
MARSIEVEAFAKINIGLRIGSRMPDGYHPISSIFHSVSLSDSLSVAEVRGGTVEVRGDFDCPPEATTIHRAAVLFLRQRGIDAGIAIEVDKRIPVQAGLGGGSADAAAVLVALDRLFPGSDGTEVLAGIASLVGSDVPFFLSGGAAYVGGRGERIEGLEPRPDLGVLLIKPAFGVSTARAYADLDADRSGSSGKTAEGQNHAPDPLSGRNPAAQMLERNPETWTFENDFSPLLFRSFGEYPALESSLREAGASFVSISGSGSCIYGVFDSLLAARSALGQVEKGIASIRGPNTLSGMALRAIKPLETSLVLR